MKLNYSGSEWCIFDTLSSWGPSFSVCCCFTLDNLAMLLSLLSILHIQTVQVFIVLVDMEIVLVVIGEILRSFFTVSILVCNELKIRDNSTYSLVKIWSLILKLLSEGLNMWSLTYLRDIWLFSATCLFVASASRILSSLHKFSYFFLLIIQVF